MRKVYTILIIILNLSCTITETPNIAIGAWYQCLRNGEYQEFKISSDYIIQLSTESEDQIHFFNNCFQDSSLIISGINVSVPYGIDTLTIVPQSNNSIMLKNRYGGGFELKRLKTEILDIDSTKIDVWKSSTLKAFKVRAGQMNCPDLRTKEEKNPIIELGVLEDDFEDIIDDKLPEWASTKFSKYEKKWIRSFQLFPSLLESDFNGDGKEDIAIFVSNNSNKKRGVMFLFGDSDMMLVAGAGKYMGSGNNDFKWADYWKVFDQRVTHETTFLENGDIEGDREVILEHDAISIRENEGSGRLIYFNGEELISIHQGD